MTAEDAPAVLACQIAAFADLERRLGMPESPAPPSLAPGIVRIRPQVGSDPAGARVTESGDRITGAALALVREGVWGLSLLVVQPDAQSGGAGSALMRAALDHGEGSRGGIILASEDARALRLYSRAGFDLRPALDARGPVRTMPAPPAAVRDVDWPADRPLVDAVSRAVRGATHAGEIESWLTAENRVLVHEDGGFAVQAGGAVKLVAAAEDRVAADLLRGVLCRVPSGDEVHVNFITAGQDWAVAVLLDAGLELRAGGAVFVRGDTGPMRPYIPSGSYL